MKKLIKYSLIFIGILLAIGVIGAALGLGDEEEAKDIESDESPEVSDTWKNKIEEIANSSDVVADKYYSIEKYMMDYEADESEVKQFADDIIADYESGSYLSEKDNHERMLTNIFKSYIVERNADGSMKDFAFDYHQNLKYVYRGVDASDSDEVKSNEGQMDKALVELNK